MGKLSMMAVITFGAYIPTLIPSLPLLASWEMRKWTRKFASVGRSDRSPYKLGDLRRWAGLIAERLEALTFSNERHHLTRLIWAAEFCLKAYIIDWAHRYPYF